MTYFCSTDIICWLCFVKRRLAMKVSSSVAAFLLLATVAMVSVNARRLPDASICMFLKCPAPECINPITPPGQCCPTCTRRIDCALVDCYPLECPHQITPRGECCPVCVKNDQGCRRGGKQYQDGERVPGKSDCRECVCRNGRIECDSIMCLDVYCEGQYKAPGHCCPVCPKIPLEIMK